MNKLAIKNKYGRELNTFKEWEKGFNEVDKNIDNTDIYKICKALISK